MLDYKGSLLQKVDKNFLTVTIGAVNAFQEEFEDLLKDPEFNERFQAARKRVLDIGNDQKRKTNKLLSKAVIKRPQYDYRFSVDRQLTTDELSRIIGGEHEGY
jgi:hypothetical protein